MAGSYNPNNNNNESNKFWKWLDKHNYRKLQKEKHKEKVAHDKAMENYYSDKVQQGWQRGIHQHNQDINDAIKNAQDNETKMAEINAGAEKEAMRNGTDRMKSIREENESNDKNATSRFNAELEAQKAQHADNTSLEKEKVKGNASRAESFTKALDTTMKSGGSEVDDKRKGGNAKPSTAKTMDEMLRAGGSHRKTEVDEKGNKHTTVTEGVGNPYKMDKINKVEDIKKPEYTAQRTKEEDIQKAGDVKHTERTSSYSEDVHKHLKDMNKQSNQMIRDFHKQNYRRRSLWDDVKTAVGNKIRDKLHIHHYADNGEDLDKTFNDKQNKDNTGGGGGE